MTTGEFVTDTAGRYQPDPATIDVDLWQSTPPHPPHPNDNHDPIETLTHAVTAYRERLTSEHDYTWAEPTRETLHRQALDARTRLAEEHHCHDDTSGAVTVMENAINLDPYNEDLYQRTIRYLSGLGCIDTARCLGRHPPVLYSGVEEDRNRIERLGPLGPAP